MNAHDPLDALLLDYQFALWREALALAHAEKAARRRFAKRLQEAAKRQRTLVKVPRATGTAKDLAQPVPALSRPGTPRRKTGRQLLQSRLLSLFRPNPSQGNGSFGTALPAESGG